MGKRNRTVNALDLIKCEKIPAIYTENYDNDCITNTDLYLELIEKGDKNGFCPVLVEKDMPYWGDERCDLSPENFELKTKKIINIVESTAFNVWKGRLLYNYFLDGIEDEEDFNNWMEILNPPKTKEYEELYKRKIIEKKFILGKTPPYRTSDFEFDKLVFALIPTVRPWEVLAWIQMGGFNWCPDSLHQVALAKELYDKFGARPLRITINALDYYVPNPLIERREVEDAAYLMTLADDDIYEDFELAVERVLGNPCWYMWWD